MERNGYYQPIQRLKRTSMVTALSEGILAFSMPTHSWHSIKAATWTFKKNKKNAHFELWKCMRTAMPHTVGTQSRQQPEPFTFSYSVWQILIFCFANTGFSVCEILIFCFANTDFLFVKYWNSFWQILMKSVTHLENNLAHTRSQVDKLHFTCDRRNEVNHLVDQVKTRLSVHFRCERLIVVQVIGVADGSVVHLKKLWMEIYFAGIANGQDAGVSSF